MMKRVLWIVAIATLAVSLAVSLWVDLVRVRWEAKNKGFVLLVRADETKGIPLLKLAEAGIETVAIRASSLREENGLSPTTIHRQGLKAALILDHPFPQGVEIKDQFTFVWEEGNLAPDDPLLIDLLNQGSILIQREFTETSLARNLWNAGFHRVVRGHEIPREELLRTSRTAILARWERAVRERGIRALILSPIPGDDPKEILKYYHEVTARIADGGHHLGNLSLPPPEPDWPVAIVFHLGISALVLLVSLNLFGHLPLACLLLSLNVGALALGVRGILLRQIDALLLALLAPTYGGLLLLPHVWSGWRSGARFLLLFSAISLSAGALLGAILAHPAFLVKVAQFRGVKTALLLPPFVGVIIYSRSASWGWLRRLLHSSRDLLGALLLLASIATVTFILHRSGNTDGLVSGVEERVRGLLEGLLIARPRFKEFLLGHPLLFLFGAGVCHDQRSERWRPFLLFFGLIGQVSILNTFAHAHTPLSLSLLRTGNGLLLGFVFGMGIYLIAFLMKRCWQQVRQHT